MDAIDIQHGADDIGPVIQADFQGHFSAGAGHGLAYAVEPDRYVEELYDFFGPECSYQK